MTKFIKQINRYGKIHIGQLSPFRYLYYKKYKKINNFLLIFDIMIWMIPFALITTLFIINIYGILKKQKEKYVSR